MRNIEARRAVCDNGVMARPREFDHDTALKGATDIFWEQGYRATNLPDLLDAMGLTRGSFYKAFRDKETIYLEALDFYDREVVDKVVDALDTCVGPTAKSCLSMLFAGEENASRGCFICNAMVELAPDHPQVAAKANAMADRMRQAIYDVLLRYDVRGAGGVASETADLILHLYFGKMAMGKAGGAQRDWRRRLQHLLQDQPDN